MKIQTKCSECHKAKQCGLYSACVDRDGFDLFLCDECHKKCVEEWEEDENEVWVSDEPQKHLSKEWVARAIRELKYAERAKGQNF